jgi:hypothetical protein
MNTNLMAHLSILKDVITGIISSLFVSPIFLNGRALFITSGISLILYWFAVIIEFKITYDRTRVTTTL